MRSPLARFACLTAALLVAPACNVIFGISEGTAQSTGGAAASSATTGSSSTGGAAASSSTTGSSSTSGSTTGAGGDSSAPAVVTLDPGFPKIATLSGTGGAAGMAALSTTFDIPAGGRMVVAVVVWGQHSGADVWPVTVASGGLSWASAAQSVSFGGYPDAVGVGIWTAWASAAMSSVTLTATRSNAVPADAVLAVYSLEGASSTIGATGTTNGFGTAAPLSVALSSVAAGSFVALGLLDGNGTSGVRGNTLATTTYDASLASGSGDGIAVGHLKTPLTASGPLTVGQDETSLQFDVGVAVEIPARQL